MNKRKANRRRRYQDEITRTHRKTRPISVSFTCTRCRFTNNVEWEEKEHEPDVHVHNHRNSEFLRYVESSSSESSPSSESEPESHEQEAGGAIGVNPDGIHASASNDENNGVRNSYLNSPVATDSKRAATLSCSASSDDDEVQEVYPEREITPPLVDLVTSESDSDTPDSAPIFSNKRSITSDSQSSTQGEKMKNKRLRNAAAESSVQINSISDRPASRIEGKENSVDPGIPDDSPVCAVQDVQKKSRTSLSSDSWNSEAVEADHDSGCVSSSSEANCNRRSSFSTESKLATTSAGESSEIPSTSTEGLGTGTSNKNTKVGPSNPSTCLGTSNRPIAYTGGTGTWTSVSTIALLEASQVATASVNGHSVSPQSASSQGQDSDDSEVQIIGCVLAKVRNRHLNKPVEVKREPDAEPESELSSVVPSASCVQQQLDSQATISPVNLSSPAKKQKLSDNVQIGSRTKLREVRVGNSVDIPGESQTGATCSSALPSVHISVLSSGSNIQAPLCVALTPSSDLEKVAAVLPTPPSSANTKAVKDEDAPRRRPSRPRQGGWSSKRRRSTYTKPYTKCNFCSANLESAVSRTSGRIMYPPSCSRCKEKLIKLDLNMDLYLKTKTLYPNAKVFNCGVCSMEFSTAAAGMSHLKVHTKQKQYIPKANEEFYVVEVRGEWRRPQPLLKSEKSKSGSSSNTTPATATSADNESEKSIGATSSSSLTSPLSV